MPPARLQVVEQEQVATGADHAEHLGHRGGAIGHITDRQGADHGLERVVAEREMVAVGDSKPHRSTQLTGALCHDVESLAAEVHRDQVDVAWIPPQVEPGADRQLKGRSPRLTTHPLPTVADQ